MSDKHNCPSPAELERLVSGRLADPQVAALAEHLDHCPRCSDTMQGLKVSDTLLDAARDSRASVIPEEPAVQQLVRQIKGLRSAADGEQTEALRPEGGSSPPFAGPAQDRCGLLAPAQGADELGRLGVYRVLKLLGTGGMGMVYQAEDTHLQRMVALKVMKPEVAKNPTARERFLREARAAARLKSDHVVTIHQVGEDRDVAFLAMEYLEGMSLEDWLKKGRPPTLAQTIRIGRQIALGLAAAHERGLIHRDVKPGNVWLESSHQGRVKLLDFGLARPAAEDHQLTQSGMIVGTPAYMAPEQARGEKVDHRADLFSLGVVLYRLTTGRLPFRGDNTLAVLSSLAVDVPTPPREINPDLPPRLAALIERLLAKDRGQRPATAKAVADELALVEREAAAAGRREPEDRTLSVAVGQVSNLPSGRKPARRRLAAAGLLALAAGVAAAIVIIIRDRDGKEVERKVLPEGYRAEIQEGKGEQGPKAEARVERPPLDPPGEGEPLWPGALVRRPAKLPGVRVWSLEKRDAGGVIGAVAYRPDGKRLAAASREGQGIRIWDPEGGRLVQVLGARGSIKTLAWSPDGRILAAGTWGDGPVQLWEAEAGRFLRTLAPSVAQGTDALAWSPDGRKLLAAGRQECLVWDAPDGKLLRRWPHDGQFLLAFSPDGRYVAGWQWNPPAVVIREAETGKEVRTVPGHAGGESPSGGVTWSPDGKRLGYGGPTGLFIWETETGKEVLRREDLKSAFVAWSPDGRAWGAAPVNNNWYRLTELGPGDKPQTLDQCGGPFAPDGKSVVGYDHLSGTIHILDPVTGQRLRRLSEGKCNGVFVALAPDGRTLAVKEQEIDAIVTVSVDTGQVLGRREGLTVPMAYSPDGKLLAAAGPDNTILLVEEGSKVRATLTGHKARVSWAGLVWSPDGKRLASAGEDRRVFVWDTEKADLLRERGPFATRWSCYPVAWSPDGRLVAIREESVGFHLWDSAENKVLNDPAKWNYASLRFTPDGTSAVVAEGSFNPLRLVDLANGGVRRTLACWTPATARPDLAGAFSPDGRLLAVAAEPQGAYLLQGDLRRRVRTLEGTVQLYGLAVVADGKLVAGWGGERLHLWEADTGRMRGTLLLGERNHGLAVTAEGHYTGDGQEERGLVAVVQKEDGTQELLEPADFEKKYGWKNDPAKVRLLEPLPPPLSPPPGDPMGPLALVREPAELPGVRSWTVETRSARGPVRAVAYRPDGKLLATGGDDGTIRLWDPATGQLVRMLVGSVVGELSWSADGRVLAAGSAHNGTWLWDADGGRLLGHLPAASWETVSLSPDGRTLAVHTNGDTLELHDVAAGRLASQHTFPGRLPEGISVTPSWSPDGKVIAVGVGKAIRLWDVASAREVRALEGHEGPVRKAAWSPDGKRLVSVAAGERAFRVWDAQTGKPQGPFALEGTNTTQAVAWSPDGKAVAIGMHQGPAGIFDPETGRLLRTLTAGAVAYPPSALALAWSPDGKQVALAGDQGVRLYDAATGKGRDVLELPAEGIGRLTWSPDGRLLALDYVNAYLSSRLVAEAATGRLAGSPAADGWHAAAWSPDGKTFATFLRGTGLRLWDAATHRLVRTLEGDPDLAVIRLAWSPDGKLVAAGGRDCLGVWSAQTGKPLWQGREAPVLVCALTWSPDGRRLATGLLADPPALLVREADTGKVLHRWPSWGEPVAAWSPDGKELAAGRTDQGECLLIDAASGTVRRKLPLEAEWLRALRWSPDGKVLHAVTDRLLPDRPGPRAIDNGMALRDFDTASGKLLRRVPLGAYHFFGLEEWSPDGRVLAGSNTVEVRLWDADGWPLGVFLPGEPYARLAVTADGHYRGSARIEREVRVVVLKDDGTSETLAPAEFEQKYGFKNDPEKVRLTDWTRDPKTTKSLPWDSPPAHDLPGLDRHRLAARTLPARVPR